MSQFTIAKLSCPDIQMYVDEAYSFFANPTMFSFVPLVQFLTSPVNLANIAGRQTLKSQAAPGGGKIRTVQIIYTPRYVESTISTTITRDCTSTNEYGHHDVECVVDLGTGIEVNERWDLEDVALICRDNGEEFAKRISSMFDGLRRALETEVTTQVAAAVGSYADEDPNVAADILTVATLADATTNQLAQEDIALSMALIGVPQVYVFGSGAIWQYANRIAASCCNNAGVDFSQMTDGINYVHSHRVDAALGGAVLEQFLMLAPGAAHLVWANLYEGASNTVQDDAHKAGILVDPMTGLPFDFTMTWDCNRWLVELSLPFTVCTAPTDYFALNDRLSGVNGIFEGDVDNS